MLPLLLTLTYQFLFFVLPRITGLPSQKFNSPWAEPLIHLKNAALSIFFCIIHIRYKQKTRQHRLHMSLMDRCLTRLIEGIIPKKKTYRTKVRCVGTIRFKN